LLPTDLPSFPGSAPLQLANSSSERENFSAAPPLSATLQVAFGGALVFGVGILIGSS